MQTILFRFKYFLAVTNRNLDVGTNCVLALCELKIAKLMTLCKQSAVTLSAVSNVIT